MDSKKVYRLCKGDSDGGRWVMRAPLFYLFACGELQEKVESKNSWRYMKWYAGRWP